MEIEIFNKFQRDLNDLNEFEQFMNIDCTRRDKMETHSSKKRQGRRFNPLEDLTEPEFRTRYRFSKENMRRLIEILRDDLEVDQQTSDQQQRKNQVPVEIQIMAAIRYWGLSEHPEITASAHQVSLRTLMKISKRVAVVLAAKASRYIRMPCLLAEKERVTNAFHALAQMPQVIGAITHISLRYKRVDNKDSKVDGDRICLQLISDACFKIRDLDCRVLSHGEELSPGDFFSQSRIKERFEQNEFRGRLLLGDQRLPCTSFLLTPIPGAISTAEQAYNNSLKLTFASVSRCLKLWRQRFGILDSEIHASAGTARQIIVALALLHNMAIEWNDPSLDEIPSESSSSTSNPSELVCKPKDGDSRARAEFIKTHFYNSVNYFQ